MWIEFRKSGDSSRHFIEGPRSIDWMEAKGVNWTGWRLWSVLDNMCDWVADKLGG